MKNYNITEADIKKAIKENASFLKLKIKIDYIIDSENSFDIKITDNKNNIYQAIIFKDDFISFSDLDSRIEKMF